VKRSTPHVSFRFSRQTPPTTIMATARDLSARSSVVCRTSFAACLLLALSPSPSLALRTPYTETLIQDFFDTKAVASSYFEAYQEQGSKTESEIFSQVKVKFLTDDEHVQMLTNRGLHPAHAERLFDEHLRHAMAKIQRQVQEEHHRRQFGNASSSFAQDGPDSEAEPEKPIKTAFTSDKAEEYEFWAGEAADLKDAFAQADTEFKKEQYRALIDSISPNLHLYICSQVNIDLSFVPPHIPFLRLNFGVMGGLSVDTVTGCWSGSLEVSMGIDWGFKVLGFTLGVGAAATGTVDFAEQIPQRVMNTVAKDETDPTVSARKKMLALKYAPDGADLSVCHSKSPWPLFQAFWEGLIKKTLSEEEVLEKIRQEQAAKKEDIDAFRAKFKEILSGTAVDVERPAELMLPDEMPFMLAPRFTQHARVFQNARSAVVHIIPLYATQVLRRVIDNAQTWKGADNERSIFSGSVARFRESDGRFLARWPDTKTLANYAKGTDKELEVTGVTKETIDMRVINFAKAVHFSKHKQELKFWKEIAVSTSNLMVRILSDLIAIFSAVWAGDPNWDGSCDALPQSFKMSQFLDTKKRKKLFEQFPFAGPTVEDRAAFLEDLTRPLFEEPEELSMYPQLWCRIAEQRFEDERSWVKKLVNDGDGYAKKVEQACTSVTHELRDLAEGDIIEWQQGSSEDSPDQETSNVYIVRRAMSKIPIGILYGEGPDWHGPVPEAALSKKVAMLSKSDNKMRHSMLRKMAHEMGFQVSERLVETRQECERVRVPRSIVAMIPSVVGWMDSTIRKFEETLMNVNGCMNELHNYNYIQSVLLNDAESTTSCSGLNANQKLEFVKGQAMDAIETLRIELAKFGAMDPREMNDRPKDFVERELPMTTQEKEVRKFALQHIKEDKNFPNTGLFDVDLECNLGMYSVRSVVARIEDLQVGDVIQYHTVDTIESRAGRSATVKAIRDGDTTPRAFTLWLTEDRHKVEKIFLKGLLWPYASALWTSIDQDPDPLRRLNRKELRLRPPVEFTDGLSFTAQLEPNAFCTPNTGILMVSYISQRSWLSWTEAEGETTEKCWIARARPGDLFVQVQRCKGKDRAKQESYSDWRVRYQASLVKFSTGGALSGAVGIFASTGNMLEAALSGAAAAGGGFATKAMTEKFYPLVRNNAVTSTMLMMGATGLPLLGVAGVGAALAYGSFHAMCKQFLSMVAPHGGVSLDEIGPNMDWGFNSLFLMWGAVIYREKEVQLEKGPSAMNLEGKTSFTKFQRFVQLHVESRNAISSPEFGGVPGNPFSVEVHAKLQSDWDITNWYTAKENAILKAQNDKRIRQCTECLRVSKAFCDWRPVLGSIWNESFDTCIDDDDLQAEICTSPAVLPDDEGKTVTGVFFRFDRTQPGDDGVIACQRIDFPRANREFRMSDTMRRWFRRH